MSAYLSTYLANHFLSSRFSDRQDFGRFGIEHFCRAGAPYCEVAWYLMRDKVNPGPCDGVCKSACRLSI